MCKILGNTDRFRHFKAWKQHLGALKFLCGQAGLQEQYTVEGIQNLRDKAVMCHRLNFQKVYCHEINATTAFMVQLVAGDGTKTQALAICHADTSGMNHEMLRQDSGPKSRP